VNAGIYTEESATAFKAALDEAKRVLGNTASTEAQIQVARGALNASMNGLTKAAATLPTPPTQQTPQTDVKVNMLQVSVANIPTQTYTGKKIQPSVTVSYSGKALASGTDYDVIYGANTSIGSGSVTVTGKGAYTGTKAVSFKIIPTKNSVKSVIVGKKSAKVYLAKASSAQKVTGYQVQYRQKGTSKWKTRTIPAKNASVTIKKLTKGKQYQFRVRSYKSVAGARYFASWSPVKTGSKIK
jgi:hypothetical protein